MQTLQEIFDSAKIGDTLVSKGKGVFSVIVCFTLKTHYSHTLVKSGHDTIIESNDLGVSEVLFKDFVGGIKHLELLGFPGSSHFRKPFLKALRKLLGKKYDWGLVIGGLLSRMCKRSRRREGLLNKGDAYTCSEVIAEALSRCGFKLPFPPSQITPEDLYYYILGLKQEGQL